MLLRNREVGAEQDVCRLGLGICTDLHCPNVPGVDRINVKISTNPEQFLRSCLKTFDLPARFQLRTSLNALKVPPVREPENRLWMPQELTNDADFHPSRQEKMVMASSAVLERWSSLVSVFGGLKDYPVLWARTTRDINPQAGRSTFQRTLNASTKHSEQTLTITLDLLISEKFAMSAKNHPPALRLPPEVLGNIMERVVAGGMNPFHLSHVCHYWREVINRIKNMWNHIQIKTARPSSKAVKPTLEHMIALLERSKGGPITVDIDYIPLEEICRVLEIIANYSVDIASLSLGIPTEDDYSNLVQTLDGLSFPILKNLAFGQIAQKDQVLRSALSLLSRTVEEGLELRIFSFPNAIIETIGQDSIAPRLKSLHLDFDEADGTVFLERHLDPMLFPTLEKVFCAGFVPILDYISASTIIDLEVEAFSCEVMEWKRFHFHYLPSSVERLTLSFVELQTPLLLKT
ncbi:14858_t:CDS:2 [Acaulospora colombiana]|uniref:14858_t:CDS:1 n=2 Tax=Acaulospora colombiana TaxID=27376 RepID=A0ACA9LR25_9GLOM|nr:14854_t:CDS:2 [Acaulospora colombiana]CAG8545808.1 14858_t:CDS:2 [Acaulospora colombiana]